VHPVGEHQRVPDHAAAASDFLDLEAPAFVDTVWLGDQPAFCSSRL
jgi:hypothetical protein